MYFTFLMEITVPDKNAELKDGRTDGRTDRQTNGYFIGPSVGRGSNNSQKKKKNEHYN